MNPLWEEQQITFNPGVTPHQLFSDTEILAAQAAGQITITDTDEIVSVLADRRADALRGRARKPLPARPG